MNIYKDLKKFVSEHDFDNEESKIKNLDNQSEMHSLSQSNMMLSYYDDIRKEYGIENEVIHHRKPANAMKKKQRFRPPSSYANKNANLRKMLKECPEKVLLH